MKSTFLPSSSKKFTMLYTLWSLTLLLLTSPLWCQPFAASSLEELSDTHALQGLERLIHVTERNLQEQKALHSAIQHYLQCRQTFMSHDQDRKAIQALVEGARAAWKLIQEQQLAATFPSDFIEELQLFAQLARKQQIAAP